MTPTLPQLEARLAQHSLELHEDETGTHYLRCGHCKAVLDVTERHEVGDCAPEKASE